MPKAINMIGVKKDRLLVIERAKNNKFNQRQWKCLCDCGNIFIANGANIRKGSIKSCGCLHDEMARNLNKKDLVNQRFGKLLVLEETRERSASGSIMWKCQCDCNNITMVPTLSLTGHKTRSCGCITTSIGEYNIEQILILNSINYKREYVFQDLRNTNGRLVRFDFAIFKENDVLSHLIEFDGIQHFKSSNASAHWSHYSLENTQASDDLKNNYCIKNNIRLIRIPYTKRDILTIDQVI